MRRAGTTEWIPAQVPGCVLNDLLMAGRLPDPYYRDQEALAREYANYDYEYTREFAVDENLTGCAQVVLSCAGLDTLAEISLNGRPVGKTKNMHRRYEFAVKEWLKPGTNRITILFRSPVQYITRRQLAYPLWGAPEALPGFPHLRKAHSMFGWDWAPQLPDAGIWREIALYGYEQGRLDEVYIVQHHEGGKVSLEVRVRKENWSESALTTGVQIRTPQGETLGAEVTSSCYEDRLWLEIPRPLLWWPHGYGEQPLYAVEVTLYAPEGTPLDRKELKIGLRTIGVRRERDRWGESFAFEVNGTAIFAMGANYIPEDSILARLSPERTERLIRDCVAANFNCLRVWGGGFYPHDYFYDFCDRYGLLVWQDFMFACADYDPSPEFAAEVRQEAADNIKRLRHHPCLALWCGNNEMEMAWAEWDFPKREAHRRNYQYLFEELLAKAVQEHDPATFYWPSSPSSGGGFVAPNGEEKGDAHYWQVWHGLKPFSAYQDHYFRFVSEFGFQSFPSLPTIASFTAPEDRNIFSPVMEQHQKNGSGNGKILAYLDEYYRYPYSLKSLVYLSQLLQAEAIKTGVEHWRRHRGRCMGALYWQLNDCWPVASWSSIEYGGRWKALHYAAKRFFAPVLLSAVREEETVALYLTNEQRRPVTGTILWHLRDHAAGVLAEGSGEAALPQLSAKKCLTIDLRELAGGFAPEKSYLDYRFISNGRELSAGTLLFTKPKYFAFLDPQLTFDLTEEEDGFTVRVKAKAFAKNVCLELAGVDVVFSDNFFDLPGGTEQAVRLDRAGLATALSLQDLREKLVVTSLYEHTSG